MNFEDMCAYKLRSDNAYGTCNDKVNSREISLILCLLNYSLYHLEAKYR